MVPAGKALLEPGVLRVSATKRSGAFRMISRTGFLPEADTKECEMSAGTSTLARQDLSGRQLQWGAAGTGSGRSLQTQPRIAAAVPANLGTGTKREEGRSDRPAQVTPRGLGRMNDVIAMVREQGRYPSTTSPNVSERSLATWLRRRRREAEAGTLDPAFRNGLAVLPHWQDTPRATADESRWWKRLAALKAYRASGQDWPRHKGATSAAEHQLGVWVHTQRFKLCRGEMTPAKAQALDAAVPGWRTGRARGPKSKES